MQKLHITPISSNFRRSNNNDIQHTDHYHFIQFDGHTVTFKPLSVLLRHLPANADLILQNFLRILRIYNEKHLQKLKLNFYDLPDLDAELLCRLGSEIVKHCRNIKELSLNFFNCSRITEEGIQYLLSPISRYVKGLQTFSLSITGSTQISKKGADHIKSLILNRVKMLTKLSLIFSGECVETVEEVFPHEVDVLTHLRKQKMSMAGSVTDSPQNENYSKAALSLCDRARYCLPNLQKLILVFPQLCHSEILDTISLVFKNTNQLRVLYLGNIDSYLTEENDDKCEEIIDYLKKNLTKLHYLTITFRKYDQTLQGDLVKMLSNILPKLSELRGFTLSFNDTEQMEDQDLLEIVNKICLHAKSLENLTLEFETLRNGSNTAISQATQTLAQSLVSLKELVLNCRYTELFEQEVIPILSNTEFPSIARLHLYLPNDSFSFDFSGCYQNLEVLTLSFGCCVDMPKGKIGTLLAPLFDYEFKNMRQLTLELGQVQQMTDKDINTLCSFNWKNLPNLQYFRFGISDQEALSDKGLGHISKLIREELKGLLSFEFILRELVSFTENGVKNLSLTIAKSMKELRNLGLYFARNVSQDIMNIIVIHITEHLKKLERISVSVNPFSEGQIGQGDIDFICEMRKKLSFIPVVDFYQSWEERET